MTLLYERTRAVVQTREFLAEPLQNQAVPVSVRAEARSLLRHYPSKDDILQAGRILEGLNSGIFSASTER